MGPSLHIRVCCDVCLFVFCVLFNKAALSSVFHTHTTEVFRVTPPAEEKSTHPLPTTASQPNPSMRWAKVPVLLGYVLCFALFCRFLRIAYLLPSSCPDCSYPPCEVPHTAHTTSHTNQSKQDHPTYPHISFLYFPLPPSCFSTTKHYPHTPTQQTQQHTTQPEQHNGSSRTWTSEGTRTRTRTEGACGAWAKGTWSEGSSAATSLMGM